MIRLTKYPFILLTCLSLLLPVGQALADQHEHEQHVAHVHGEALLLVAVDGNTVEMELRSPAMNILGFEHRPQTELQRQQADQAVTTLKDAGLLFSLPAGALCYPDQVDTAFEDHDGHAEFIATYSYTCRKPALIKQLLVKLFEQFPLTERIEAQSISPRGQHAMELDAENRILDL